MPRPSVLALAAPSAAALREAAERLLPRLDAVAADAFPSHPSSAAPPAPEGHAHRLALVSTDAAAAAALVRRFLDGQSTAPQEDDRFGPEGVVVSGVAPARPVPLCFLMSDVGTDWWGAGAWLLPEGPGGGLLLGGEASALTAASSVLVDSGWPDPRRLLTRPADEWRQGAACTAAQAHAGLFGLHMALLAVWERLGVTPDAVASFSMGEPSGAVACGALTPSAGAAVMSAMTECVSRAEGTGGGMLAVIGLPEDELRNEAAKQPDVEVGAVFGAAAGALTGSLAGLSVAEARLKPDSRVKVVVRPAVTKAAYHSAVFEPMRPSFLGVLAAPLARVSTADACGTTTKWYTSVDGGRTADPVASAHDPSWWFAGLRAPALSHRACEAVLDDGYRLFVELNGSPFYCHHPVGDEMRARGLCGEADAGGYGVSMCTMRASPAEVGADVQVLAALCRLWCAGASVDWAALYQGLGQGHKT